MFESTYVEATPTNQATTSKTRRAQRARLRDHACARESPSLFRQVVSPLRRHPLVPLSPSHPLQPLSLRLALNPPGFSTLRFPRQRRTTTKTANGVCVHRRRASSTELLRDPSHPRALELVPPPTNRRDGGDGGGGGGEEVPGGCSRRHRGSAPSV